MIKGILVGLIGTATLCTPAYSQEAISIDKFKYIEYAVKSSSTEGKWEYFILQKPLTKGVYCGWIVERFAKPRSPERESRLFIFMEPNKLNGDPLVSIDRPEDPFSFPIAPMNCHSAGYIAARMPVGKYAYDYLDRMIPNDVYNNFQFIEAK